jgi:hypothetical protein
LGLINATDEHPPLIPEVGTSVADVSRIFRRPRCVEPQLPTVVNVGPDEFGADSGHRSAVHCQLATFIHSRASTAVREFARAFDLKKDR